MSAQLPPSSPLKQKLDTYVPFLYRPARSAFQAIRAWKFQRRYRRLAEKVIAERGPIVQSGPLRDMRYLDRACSSVLIPKLLGTYEDELNPIWDRLDVAHRTAIVDIGCAEGYYAVGLARISPAAQVFAYDIDPVARAGCRKLAELNGVAERVIIGERFEPAIMLRFADTRPLVVCDVDGFEVELFTPATADYWRSADLVVELHDYLGTPCRESVEGCLAATHDLEIIASRNKTGDEYPQLAYLSAEERRLAVSEIRAPQHWLIAYARCAS